MKSITVPAELDQLKTVQDFIEAQLETANCPMKTMLQIQVAVEEIFVNIARYAYFPQTGTAVIDCRAEREPSGVIIRFQDQGKPFNPLEKEDADTTLSAEERQIGGLGILMVKKSMDRVSYEYKDGRNLFTMEKNW